jgi:hypothetical protein
VFSDYFTLLGLPALYIATGLLQPNLDILYRQEKYFEKAAVSPGTTRMLTAVIELLWTCIFSVKFCLLAQFKFHKPPYAYISPYLTRYYWASVCICVAGYLYALAQPIIVCPTFGTHNRNRLCNCLC